MTAVDFVPFVERLAKVSGEAIMPFFRTAFAMEDKSCGGVFDPVTEADRGAEAAMRRLIAEVFPHHGVIGEEFGAQGQDAEYVWVLDPIDGTKSFIAGLPLWGTLIGLLHKGSPCYGLMHQPFTREKFFGDGEAAHWTGRGANGETSTRRLLTRVLLRPRPRHADDHVAQADPRAAAPALRGAGGADPAGALRRRLLCLLHAGGRPCRPRGRGGAERL